MERFLVLWKLELGRLSPDAVWGVMRMPEYGARLEKEGKVLSRYYIIGSHGGAWIYTADSHRELDQLLALAPVYNFATYQVYPLADMADDPRSWGRAEGLGAGGERRRSRAQGLAHPVADLGEAPVVNAVVHGRCFPPAGDQSSAGQPVQMRRGVEAGNAGRLGDFVHRQLTALHHGVEDAQASGIAEEGKSMRCLLDLPIIHDASVAV